MGVSPPQMLPKRSSNASALVQSKSQVRRPLRYGATGVQSHPIFGDRNCVPTLAYLCSQAKASH